VTVVQLTAKRTALLIKQTC